MAPLQVVHRQRRAAHYLLPPAPGQVAKALGRILSSPRSQSS